MSSEDNFLPGDAKKALELQAMAGEKASQCRYSEWYEWFNKNILMALEDKAINTLKNATSEEKRLEAQKMFLAADEPRQILNELINVGKDAVENLRKLSTLEDENNGKEN